MRTLLLIAALSFAASAQTISGIVVDEKGAPLAGVSVQHVVFAFRPLLTDANGAFRVSPGGAAVVLRKAGYDSAFLRIGTERNFRIEMHPARERHLPKCEANARCEKFGGATGSLCFPVPANVTTNLEKGPDGAAIIYRAKGPSGERRAIHGIGFSWSLGPSSYDVWGSAEYSEVVYSDLNIIDARGVTGAGKHWRFFGITPGPNAPLLLEGMEYRDLDPASAAIFDQAIDGACLLH